MMKKPISATIDSNLTRWINDEIKKNKRFRNKSHLIETALELLKEKNKKEV